MAYCDFGVWALIAQYLTNTVVDTLALFVIVSWRPKLQFSLIAAKPLVSYGWKVMFTDLIGTIFNNLGNMIIGIQYTSADLAYYSKGKNLPMLARNNIFTTLISVLFPGMSNVNEDIGKVKKLAQKSISTLSYLIYPIMVGLIVVAEPLTVLLYTEKWVPIVPYIGIVCIESMISIPGTITLQAIKAVGRSDIMLKMEFIKKPFLVVSIIIAMKFGVFAIALTLPINTLLDFIINGIAAQKLIEYNLYEQFKDCFKALGMSMLMGLIVYGFKYIPLNNNTILFIQVFIGGCSYLLISLVTKNNTLIYLRQLISKR
jgi:O-antigen/teichoic acid export membrane protein